MKALKRYCALCVMALSLVPIVATAEQASRDSLVIELRKQLGIEEILAASQQATAEATARQVDLLMEQFKELLARVPADKRKKFDAAIKEYVATVTTSFNLADAMSAWDRLFGPSLTDQELKEMVEDLRTTEGRKRFMAVNEAAIKWQSYLQEKQAETAKQAATIFAASLKEIVSEGQTNGANAHNN
jgi:hypothetical protein